MECADHYKAYRLLNFNLNSNKKLTLFSDSNFLLG